MKTATTEYRLRLEPDAEPYDDSYIDTWDIDHDEKVKVRNSLWYDIEHEGVWGFIAERKCTACGQWEHVESCWGFIGEDTARAEGESILASMTD